MHFIWMSFGAVGGVAIRYGLQVLGARFLGSASLGTLVANLLGSFIIGYAFAISENLSHSMSLGIITGFLGALTTMSSFMLDISQLSTMR